MNAARLERGPLSRRMILSGPADDFQRTEMARIMAPGPGGQRGSLGPRLAAAGGALMTLPLIVEAGLLGLLGFALGLLLTYLLELRRRARRHDRRW